MPILYNPILISPPLPDPLIPKPDPEISKPDPDPIEQNVSVSGETMNLISRFLRQMPHKGFYADSEKIKILITQDQ